MENMNAVCTSHVSEVRPRPGLSLLSPLGLVERGRASSRSPLTPVGDQHDTVSSSSSRVRLAELRSTCDGPGVEEKLGELAGDLAHEMRNPLTSVLACLDVLEEDVSTSGCVLPRGDKGEAISDIREGINQLSGVIEWFLGVCRGPESESLGWLDLNAAVRRAVALLQRDWGSKVEVHCRLGDLPAMRAFGRQLTQVIVNLLVNACQASDAGQIWLETSMVDSRVFVAVRDDGEGMAPEQIHRAFEAGVTSRPGEGSGLGLAISRKIIEKHSGKIWVESLMGHGTTVTVEVPANLDNVAVRKATLSP